MFARLAVPGQLDYQHATAGLLRIWVHNPGQLVGAVLTLYARAPARPDPADKPGLVQGPLCRVAQTTIVAPSPGEGLLLSYDAARLGFDRHVAMGLVPATGAPAGVVAELSIESRG